MPRKEKTGENEKKIMFSLNGIEGFKLHSVAHRFKLFFLVMAKEERGGFRFDYRQTILMVLNGGFEVAFS